MKCRSLLWMPVVLFLFSGALAPSGVLGAQPTAGASAPAAANPLDELTGPIALYPDALVVQILTASQNYDTVKLFAGWLEKNAKLKGTELQDAAQKAGFSEALVALAPFPQVVKTMVEKPGWTKALGQAAANDKKGVGESIQRMRGQAMAMGNLKTTPEQVVTVTNVVVQKTVEQQVVVVTNTIVQIQPANPQVIYVPTYPQTVYVYSAPPPSSTSVAGAALVGFTVGVIVGANNSHYHHHYDDYWDDRADNARENQDERQGNSQERQSDRQGNQDQRQSDHQGNQDQRQSNAQEKQGQRQSGGASAQSQGAQGQSAAAPSTRGGGSTASGSSGMSSGGFSGYQSGASTRSQSSRGSSSMSSSRSSGGRSSGGGRSGGGRR